MKSYMTFKIDKMPNCKICGKPMGYWRVGQEDYAHPECLAEEIANELMKGIKKDLSKVMIG